MPTSEIVMVVNGPAVTTLTGDKWTAFLQANPMVEVDACQNALPCVVIKSQQLI